MCASSLANVINGFVDAFRGCAMRATKKVAVRALYPVPDDWRIAARAMRRNTRDSTFKTVEGKRLAFESKFKRAMIIISTIVAYCHLYTPVSLERSRKDTVTLLT